MSSQVIRTIVIPAGKVYIETTPGRIFKVVSASGAFTISVDGGVGLPMATGRGFGSETSARFERLLFTDTSGSANTVEYYAGDEPLIVPEPTSVTLDPASAEAITPGQQVLVADSMEVDDDAITFYDCKSITITNTGETDITFDGGNGPRTLRPGQQKSFSVFRHQDILDEITVDTSGGGLAEVDTLE